LLGDHHPGTIRHSWSERGKGDDMSVAHKRNDASTEQASPHVPRRGSTRTALRTPQTDESWIAGLQNAAGNAAVVAVIDATRSRTARTSAETRPTGTGLPIQRAPHPESSESLKQMYAEMTERSPTFRELDDQVSSRHAIRLSEDNPSGHGVQYNPSSHTIFIPPSKAPLPDRRFSLMFEMHNALHRDAFSSVDQRLPRGGGADAHLAPYVMAARALAQEWIEWNTSVSTEIRALKVNFEMGNPAMPDAWRQAVDDDLSIVSEHDVGGSGVDLHQHVRNEHLKQYDGKLPENWRSFVRCVMAQIRAGHTAAYDPAVATNDWVGAKLLIDVMGTNYASVEMSKDEIGEFLNGNRPSVKNIKDNPFTSTRRVVRVAGERPTPVPE
jgi:hypothetical protein